MTLNIKEQIRPVSKMQENPNELMKYIKEKKSPIIFTQDGSPCGVLMDVESYQEMIDTISMLKIIEHSEQAISSGDVYKNEDVFAEIQSRLADKN